MGLEDIFNFGKHKGHQVEDVIEDDLEYIVWLVEERDFHFDDEVLEKIERNRS